MGITKNLRDFIGLLKDEIIAVLFSIIIFVLLLLISRDAWGYLFAILVSYLIAQFISSLFIIGGSGIVQMPFTGSRITRNMGHGYLVFLLSIIIGTFSSGTIADTIMKEINNNNTPYFVVILSNLILALLVFLNFHTMFYSRK